MNKCCVTARNIQYWFKFQAGKRILEMIQIGLPLLMYEDMGHDVNEKLKKIKSSFRLMMNGVASQSMREKGLGYKINWGVSLPALKSMAAEYGKDSVLAEALWHEDIRECKILATMIMPAEDMDVETARSWMKQISNQEMAEMTAFNLFQYLAEAKGLALEWISSGNDVEKICGYNVAGRLFVKGWQMSNEEADVFFTSVKSSVCSGNLAVRHAAVNALSRLDESDERVGMMLKMVLDDDDLNNF